jgi:hypothetical protein
MSRALRAGVAVMTKRVLLFLALMGSCVLTSADVHAGGVVHVRLAVEPGGRFLVGRPPAPWLEAGRGTLSLRHHGMGYAHVLGAGPHGVLFAGGKLKPFKWHLRGPEGEWKGGPGEVQIRPPHGHGRGGGRVHLKF